MGAESYGAAPAKSACEQFHIRTDWPVLVVEDTEDRISWFRKRMPKAVFAKNAEAAFRALERQDFKVIFLDHDLHWMHADNSIFKGTGKEVAQFLSEKGFRGIVIIHSKHVEGAAIMKRFLPNAKLAPFETFNIVSDATR
jgi:CheY-like chemotaxis protein